MIKTRDADLLSELAQFTGTTAYRRSTLGRLMLTDGVQYLRERASCYWLVDVIESYQPQLNSPFQLWSINVSVDATARIEMREDSGLEPLVSQAIAHTDFPLRSYELYCVDRVLMLKGEY